MTLYEDNPEEIKKQIELELLLKIEEAKIFLKKCGYKVVENK